MDYAGGNFEIKELTENGQIEGVLAGFDNVDYFGDKLLPGSLSKSLAARSRPLPMLLSHKVDRPIGAWTNWREDRGGLYVQGKMTLAARDAQEAYELAKDGALTGLSIGFMLTRSAIDADGTRLIQEAELLEGSLVSVAANDRARVTSLKAFASARDIAEVLQSGGMSSRKAKLVAGYGWKLINPDDAADEARVAAMVANYAARIRAIGGRKNGI